ncbi:hypothetical protein [Streptomyces pseudovenezuelae]|uniref:hypothetical protein n=1 Tax=Streptomyces pseudovenezuelae TaxID=67350 RepID=UPI002E344548|nr:hypothetical protein [Streptomyces pseudovenezuelae]
MSVTHKRLLSLVFSLLLSVIVGVAWGFILYATGEPGRKCVAPAGGAFGGSLVLCVAVIMLFPFRDDSGELGQTPPPGARTRTR